MQSLQEFETNCNPVTARAIIEPDQRLETLRRGGFVSARPVYFQHTLVYITRSCPRMSPFAVTKLRGFTLNAMPADVSLPPLIRLSMVAERVAGNVKSSLAKAESRRCRSNGSNKLFIVQKEIGNIYRRYLCFGLAEIYELI